MANSYKNLAVVTSPQPFYSIRRLLVAQNSRITNAESTMSTERNTP